MSKYFDEYFKGIHICPRWVDDDDEDEEEEEEDDLPDEVEGMSEEEIYDFIDELRAIPKEKRTPRDDYILPILERRFY